MRRRFSSLAAKERSKQRGRRGGGGVGAGAVSTRRTLTDGWSSLGQLRRTPNDGALGGAETVREQHRHHKYATHTITKISSEPLAGQTA